MTYLTESIREWSSGGGGSRKVGGRSFNLHTSTKNPVRFRKDKPIMLMILRLMRLLTICVFNHLLSTAL